MQLGESTMLLSWNFCKEYTDEVSSLWTCAFPSSCWTRCWWGSWSVKSSRTAPLRRLFKQIVHANNVLYMRNKTSYSEYPLKRWRWNKIGIQNRSEWPSSTHIHVLTFRTISFTSRSQPDHATIMPLSVHRRTEGSAYYSASLTLFLHRLLKELTNHPSTASGLSASQSGGISVGSLSLEAIITCDARIQSSLPGIQRAQPA